MWARQQAQRGRGENGADGQRRKGVILKSFCCIIDFNRVFSRFGRTHQNSCWTNTKTKSGTSCEENSIGSIDGILFSNIVTVWGLTLDQQNSNRDSPDETFLTWYIPIIEDLASFEGESIPPFKTLFLWIRDLATVIDL